MDRRFIVFTIFLFENAAGYISPYYMDNYCSFGTGSGSIDISDTDAIRLRLTSSWQYDENMDCTVKITTSYSNQLMLYFRSIDIEGTGYGSCKYDYLGIYDGSSTSSSYVSGFYGKQCGSYITSSVETSTGNTVTLRFKSDGSMQGKGFDMVITSYD
ncbi:TLL1-like protein, partial [Mya arenaria]